MKELESAAFAVIADWHHYAILEMTYKPDFRLDARWIADRLGIGAAEARAAIGRLTSLGLLRKDGERWVKTDVRLDTKDKTKSTRFLRRPIEQMLSKARVSLEADPLERRNHVYTTFCADPERIADAKKKIQTILWELTEFIEGPAPTEVYHLGIQLFPLERTVKKNAK